MKKWIVSLMIALMSVMTSTPASATTGMTTGDNLIPTNVVVKQTTHFNDGRTLIVYYKKSGSQVEVYSPCSDKDYKMSDASKIESTNFEVVNKVEGKLYRKATIGEVAKIIKQLVNKYL